MNPHRFIWIYLFAFLFPGRALVQEKLGARDFKQQLEASNEALLLDVRTAHEVSKSYIKGAVFLDFHDTAFTRMLRTLDSSKTVFVYCAIGVRSHDAAVMLKDLGFRKVYDLKGGIINWKLAGLPVVKGRNFDKRLGLSKKEFTDSAAKHPLTLVDFYAPWCAPCKIMVPALDSMKMMMSDTVHILTINADENLRLMKQLKFYSLPHVMLYKEGKLVFEQDGYMSRREMEDLVRRFYR
jgi:thioredoxin 1